MQKLADLRTTSASEAAELIKSLPAVAWLAYGIHGSEISSPDAALLLAYHLVAAQGDDVAQEILEHTVVIINPMQNPDGRDRFIQHFRDTRGPEPDAAPSAAEHNSGWPGGRWNHYLFDMNRDWFALTQSETRARVKSCLEWRPVVYVDLHEMGGTIPRTTSRRRRRQSTPTFRRRTPNGGRCSARTTRSGALLAELGVVRVRRGALGTVHQQGLFLTGDRLVIRRRSVNIAGKKKAISAR